MYLQRTPLFKFSMRIAADIALALAVVLLSDHRRASSYGALLMLVWSSAGCISEYSIIAPDGPTLVYELRSFVSADKPSIYRSNALNILDFLTFHLLLVASIWRLVGDEVATAHRAPPTRIHARGVDSHACIPTASTHSNLIGNPVYATPRSAPAGHRRRPLVGLRHLHMRSSHPNPHDHRPRTSRPHAHQDGDRRC